MDTPASLFDLGMYRLGKRLEEEKDRTGYSATVSYDWEADNIDIWSITLVQGDIDYNTAHEICGTQYEELRGISGAFLVDIRNIDIRNNLFSDLFTYTGRTTQEMKEKADILGSRFMFRHTIRDESRTELSVDMKDITIVDLYECEGRLTNNEFSVTRVSKD
ncbi:hypothetical protein [Pukyongiella litopenaei]|uniref:Uncharacterized protein n=1 Tax=Pukyongiella litopenaei TaxID=2605946 RepID=A0A5C2H7I0_9RHOB|nr:hypothetical protein [Pukyongiella litopenaei]QEP30331.1 hypothetical protein C6Y53_19060 [Pukyongiella litopenaei]